MRLGIDLIPDGVTPNDAGDGDTGANNLQNFPVLTSITSSSSNTTTVGTLNSAANTQFRIELFSNSACDPTGYGEGETLIGSTNVTTDGTGNAGFTFNSSASVPVGHFITATATDPNNNTSEFSQCMQVPAPVPNSPPVANNRTVTTDPNTIAAITLTGTDANIGDSLTFIIESLPTSGDLAEEGTTLAAPTVLSGDTVLYTPQFGFTGTDTFTFKVSDGTYNSNIATVTINVACISPAGIVAVGWTLVGWTCNSPGDPAALAAELGGAVRIYGYDPGNPTNPWKIYDSAAPPFVQTLSELVKLRGYWVYWQP